MAELFHALQHLPMSYYAFAGLLNFLTTCALGIFILLRNPHGRATRWFGLWSLLVAHWAFYYFLWTSASSPEAAHQYGRMTFVAPAMMPGVFVDFTAAFVGLRLPTLFRLLNYLLGLCFVGLIFHPSLLVAGAGPIVGFPYYPKAGPLMWLHFLHFAAGVAGSHLIMLRAWPRAQGVFRQQLSIMGLGTLTAYVGGGMNYLPVFGLPIPPVLTPLVTVYVASVAYGMARLRLLDVRVAITKTGLMLATYLVVLGGPLALSLWGQGWLEAHLGRYWWSLPLGLSTLLASVGPFAYARLWQQAREGLLKELARKEAELTKTQAEAATDVLTGSLARRAFMERAQLALLRARQLRRPCTLIMLDLDHFKEKNDQYGHLVGDAILKEVVARLYRTIRPQDLLGRYGGEELALLLIGTAPDEALPVAERLRAVVAQELVQCNHVGLTQTLSLGIAGFPDDAQNLEGLIGKADQALYTAKRSGRNRVVRL